MHRFLNKELFNRIISITVYVPVVILPLFYSNYISIVVYLLFASMICIEINDMKFRVSKKIFFNLYLILATSSFFLFLFLLITNKTPLSLILFIIIIIWQFDTFSFLGGKIIGGKKLMPKISSGKTISGLIAGTLITLIITEIMINFYIPSNYFSLLFTFSIIVLSFCGDTLVSLLKRFASLKDTGDIMPGHGGLLDRFDSFILVFFTYGIINLFL